MKSTKWMDLGVAMTMASCYDLHNQRSETRQGL